MDTYPIEESVATNLDVNQWAQDSFEISSTFLYEGKFIFNLFDDAYQMSAKINIPNFTFNLITLFMHFKVLPQIKL